MIAETPACYSHDNIDAGEFIECEGSNVRNKEKQNKTNYKMGNLFGYGLCHCKNRALAKLLNCCAGAVRMRSKHIVRFAACSFQFLLLNSSVGFRRLLRIGVLKNK